MGYFSNNLWPSFAVKTCMNIWPRTLSVPRSKQVSLRNRLGSRKFFRVRSLYYFWICKKVEDVNNVLVFERSFLKNTFIILFCRFKEMKMNAIIKEVALYCFFVACLCIVSYSHRDPTSFAFRQTMYNSFVQGVHGGSKTFSAVSILGTLA